MSQSLQLHCRLGFAKALCTASPSAQQRQVTFIEHQPYARPVPDTPIYLFRSSAYNSHPYLPSQDLGCWDLALPSIGRHLVSWGLLHFSFDSMKRNL